MTDHQHVTQQCATHGFRLGGCKCLVSLTESIRYVQVECGPGCPKHEPTFKREREGTWSDIHMGERDVE